MNRKNFITTFLGKNEKIENVKKHTFHHHPEEIGEIEKLHQR
jgi:hypothetical protein